MRKLLSVFVGFILLGAAAVVLWFALGPAPKEHRTTGGVLTSQQEAAQGVGVTPDLGLTTDQGPSSTNVLSAMPEISGAALANAASAETPLTTAEQPPASGAPPITTDIVLTDQTNVAVAPLDLSQIPYNPSGQGGPGSFGQAEQRVVELEWPKDFRAGGSGTVRITLKMLSDGSIQPVAEIAGNEVLATPILISDRYADFTPYVTAALSAPNFTVETVSQNTQLLERGGELTWRWTLKADKTGRYVIAIGLSLQWVSKTSGAAQSPVSIWGQALQVDVNQVFGMVTVPQASVGGTVLAVLGFVAEMPLLQKLLESLWDALFKRQERKEDQKRTSSRRRRQR
jgi:hypothetical protein